MNDDVVDGSEYILQLLFFGFLAMTNQAEHFVKDAEDALLYVVTGFCAVLSFANVRKSVFLVVPLT
jgi:hypothetical protein